MFFIILHDGLTHVKLFEECHSDKESTGTRRGGWQIDQVENLK